MLKPILFKAINITIVKSIILKNLNNILFVIVVGLGDGGFICNFFSNPRGSSLKEEYS